MTGKRLLLSALVFGGLLGATGQIHADTSTTSTSSSKASLLKTIKRAKSKTNKGYPKYYKFKVNADDRESHIGGGRYNYYRYQTMQKAIKKANKVYKNSKASVASVNKVNTQLRTAIGNLIDHKSFYKINNKFEALKRDNYTVNSFNNMSMTEASLFDYYNTKSKDISQKSYNEEVKEIKAEFKHLKKHKWDKTNKLWGKLNKKTGKFYYNKDSWGRKVVEYEYQKTGKYKKQPFAYVILDFKDKQGAQYTVYRLDNNHTSVIVTANID